MIQRTYLPRTSTGCSFWRGRLWYFFVISCCTRCIFLLGMLVDTNVLITLKCVWVKVWLLAGCCLWAWDRPLCAETRGWEPNTSTCCGGVGQCSTRVSTATSLDHGDDLNDFDFSFWYREKKVCNKCFSYSGTSSCFGDVCNILSCWGFIYSSLCTKINGLWLVTFSNICLHCTFCLNVSNPIRVTDRYLLPSRTTYIYT